MKEKNLKKKEKIFAEEIKRKDKIIAELKEQNTLLIKASLENSKKLEELRQKLKEALQK